MTLSVGLDLTCLEDVVETGVERYARRLAETLPRVAPDLALTVIVREGMPAPAVPEPGRVLAAPQGLGRALWRETVLPGVVARERIDVLHSPVAAAPTLCQATRVVTIHDVPDSTRAPGEGGRFSKHRLRLLHALAVADAVVTVSGDARAQICAVSPKSTDAVTVIRHGVDPDFRPAGPVLDRARYGIPPGPFALCVSTVRARKDPETLIRAFAKAVAGGARDLRLVLAGKHDVDPAPLRELAAASGVGDRVVFTGYVSREDLPDLYREAAVYVLASRLEGFGMTLLEAMASGAPVIGADAASIPEVVGDGGLLFPVGDSDALAAAMLRVLGDEAERAALRERGFARAKQFTWDESARRHADLYRAVAAKKKVAHS